MIQNDEENRADFSQKMVDILNAGAVNLALGIGYRVRLFDIMDEMDVPASVEAIAERCGLHPRYVREWMGVMLTAGIVECRRDASGEALYRLPRAHGDLLTRRAGNANLGVYTQEIPLLTALAMDAVTERFLSGEGVPYAQYPKFQAFMTELANAKHKQVLVDEFLPWVDGGRMIQKLLEGIRVCDLGCGEGLACLLMAQAFPRSFFVGMDVDPEVTRKARYEAADLGLTNISFRTEDAARIVTDNVDAEAYDYITAFDAVHDQTRPREALDGVYHMLRPGGVFSMIDIAARTEPDQNTDHPMGPFLYTVSLMHCMPVGLGDGTGEGLGMMWGREKAEAMLRDAGFSDVTVSEIPNDPFNLHYLCRKA